MTCRSKILAVLTGSAIAPALTILVAWDLYRRYSKVLAAQSLSSLRRETMERPAERANDSTGLAKTPHRLSERHQG